MLPDLQQEQKDTHEEDVKALMTAIQDIAYKKAELAATISRKNQLEKRVVRRIRDLAMQMKRSPYRDETLIAQLGVKCKGHRLELSDLRPTLKAKVKGSDIELHFNKHHKLVISVYYRSPGGEWEYIGNETMSPFIDKRPLAEGMLSEKREYMAMFTNMRETFGQQSDIVTVTYGG